MHSGRHTFEGSLQALATEFHCSESKLSNGLRVVCVPRPSLHSASVALYVRVGSRYEPPEINGVSHFLEHMLYRGTSSLPTAHDQALAFEGLGGMLYAATASDHGLMSLSLPPEMLLQALSLLGEVVLAPRFSAIEVERRIVHEEILEDLDDEGRQIDADNLVRELLYGSHPLGFTITGSVDHLERFDEQTLRAHHARHYGTANSVLAVAGSFEEDKLHRALEQAFGALGPGQPCDVSPPDPAQGDARFLYVESDGSQTDVRVAFRAPGDHAPDEPAAEVLLRVLDDGMSTRLYGRICDQLGLCYSASASYETFSDDGVFDLAAETQHARAALVTGELLQLCSELAEHGPTEEELDKVRARALWSTRSLLDDADGLASFYGLASLASVAATPALRCEQLLAIGREDVRRVAESMFRPERLAVVAVGVLPKGEIKRLEKVVRSFGCRE